jgi:hypothetical protein
MQNKSWRLFRDEAFLLLKDKKYSQSIEIMRQGASVARDNFNNGSVEYAEAVAEVGYIYAVSGNLNEAIPYLKLAISIYEDQKRETKESVDSYWNLGYCYNELHDCYNADFYLKKAIASEIRFSDGCSERLEDLISRTIKICLKWFSDENKRYQICNFYFDSIRKLTKETSIDGEGFFKSLQDYFIKPLEIFIKRQLRGIPLEKRLDSPSYIKILLQPQLSFSFKWQLFDEALSYMCKNEGASIKTFWMLIDYSIEKLFILRYFPQAEINKYLIPLYIKAIQFAKRTDNQVKEEYYTHLLSIIEKELKEDDQEIGVKQESSIGDPRDYSFELERIFSDVAGNQTHQVSCSLFSVPEANCGDYVFIQIFVHLNDKNEEAKYLAKEIDPYSSIRQSKILEKEVHKSARLSFELDIKGVEVAESIQHLIWKGQTESIQYEVEIPKNYDKNSIIGKVRVVMDNVPIGHFSFTIKIITAIEKPNNNIPKLEPTEMTRYRYAFISYASKDRDEVLKRVQMLDQFKINYFQDILTLNSGDRWEKEIYKHIDLADIFFLFWSSNAKDSVWVLKEIDYALNRKGENDSNPPEIIPIIIQKQPFTEPPERLKHLHFNDKLTYFLKD